MQVYGFLGQAQYQVGVRLIVYEDIFEVTEIKELCNGEILVVVSDV